MKTLELITRTDIDGSWIIIRLCINGKKEQEKFYPMSKEDEANNDFDKAIENFEVLGKEEKLRTASFNDDVRRVWVSLVDGGCVEKSPENEVDSFVSIVTDAPTEMVAKTFAMCHGNINDVVFRLTDNEFSASRQL